MQPRLDVRPFADELVGVIVQRKADERVRWLPDGSVELCRRKVLARVAPAGSACRRTLEGRRWRFWNVLDQRLYRAGWEAIGPNHYAPAPSRERG